METRDQRGSLDASLDEVVWGAEGIGAVINRTPKQTLYLLHQGLLPAQKIGGRWSSTRRALRQRVSLNQEAAA